MYADRACVGASQKREAKLYFHAFKGRKQKTFGMLLCCGFLVHNFRLSRFITCVLIASIEYTNAITYLDVCKCLPDLHVEWIDTCTLMLC